MSSGYKVDLSALDEVITKLNRIVDGMGSPKQKAKYDTYLPEGWLGKNFQEEKDLRGEHNKMKSEIEGYIDTLEKMISDFGSNTSKARRNYDTSEQDAEKSVTSQTDIS